MAISPIRDLDKFLVERTDGGSVKNYYCFGEDFKDFVPPFEVGTCMAFWQTAAPMFWTRTSDSSHAAPPGGKKTGFQHATARVISGTPDNNTRGSRTVQQVCNANIAIPLNNHTHGVSVNNHGHSGAAASHGHGVTENSHSHGSASSGGSHKHTWRAGTPSYGTVRPRIMNLWKGDPITWPSAGGSGGPSGASGVSFSVSNKSMSFTCASANAPVTINHVANSNVTGSSVGNKMSFAVKYCDCILATKDPY